MKFRVMMKDPDALLDAISDAMTSMELPGMASDEADAVKNIRREKFEALCERWFEYGEYLMVEIDTDLETCTVVRVDELPTR